MDKICYTPTQVKLVKTSFIFIIGFTLFQMLTIRELVRKYEEGQRRFETLHEGTVYLLNIMEENDIDMSEFDVIALTNIFDGTSNE